MFKELNIDGINKKYLIDENGNIFDIKENKYRKPSETDDGYLKISFYIYGKYKRKLVHRLVMMTFKPIDNMDEFQVNHIDGDKKNNNIDNLEWCTLEENMKHAWSHGLCKNSCPSGDESHASILNECIVKKILQDLQNKTSYQKIANKYGVSKSTIYQIKNSITWKNVSI